MYYSIAKIIVYEQYLLYNNVCKFYILFYYRICHCEGEEGAPLLAPCYCSGSLRYVHQACLQQWIKASDTRACELCKFTFIMHAKTKPFCEVSFLCICSVYMKKFSFRFLKTKPIIC